MMDLDFYTQVDKELTKIPYCSQKCNYYSVCPVCDRSGSELAACSMRMLPETKRRRFVNLYLRGRDGMRAESTELLFNLAARLDLKNNPQDMITYIDTVLKIDRAFKAPEAELKRAYEIKNAEIIPDKVEVIVNRKMNRTDPNEKIVRQSEKELEKNPESLFNSEVTDLVALPIKPKREIVIDLRGVGPVPEIDEAGNIALPMAPLPKNDLSAYKPRRRGKK